MGHLVPYVSEPPLTQAEKNRRRQKKWYDKMRTAQLEEDRLLREKVSHFITPNKGSRRMNQYN